MKMDDEKTFLLQSNINIDLLELRNTPMKYTRDVVQTVLQIGITGHKKDGLLNASNRSYWSYFTLPPLYCLHDTYFQCVSVYN